MRRRVVSDHTMEELGRSCVMLELEIEWDLYPAEPMVRYYSDGSGHPGSPAELDDPKVIVTRAMGDDWDFARGGRPDWFALLDKVAANIVEYHLDAIKEYALEQVSEMDDQNDGPLDIDH